MSLGTDNIDSIDYNAIPYLIMSQLVNDMNISNNNNINLDSSGDTDEHDISIGSNQSNGDRYIEERVLIPRSQIGSLENSFIETINTSVPSQDELIIRQRGRKKAPAKISWSPIKSPFKTPTKRNSTLHMSLLSPSPAKKLFSNGTQMSLRSSPRKRILCSPSQLEPSTSCSTPTKRVKIQEEENYSAKDPDVPLENLLKGLTQEQLISLICNVSGKAHSFESEIRDLIPLPDIRAYEDQLLEAKRSITRSSPRSRLMSKTDGAAYTRAAPYLTSFKKLIVKHCKNLLESQHYGALLDYISVAWSYVKQLPSWDDPGNNIVRRECFKILTHNTKAALKNGGRSLDCKRIADFQEQIKSMSGDFDEIGKCLDSSVTN